MSIEGESDGYQVCLLRLWRTSIESPGTGERQSLANLEQLSAYLEHRVSGRCRTPPSSRAPDTGRT